MINTLFNEELGWILEVDELNKYYVINKFAEAEIPCTLLGVTRELGPESKVSRLFNCNKHKSF